MQMPAFYMCYARYTPGIALHVPSINLRACHKVVDICIRAGQRCGALPLHLLNGLRAPQHCFSKVAILNPGTAASVLPSRVGHSTRGPHPKAYASCPCWTPPSCGYFL